MASAREAALALMDIHRLLNTVRVRPAVVVVLPGATLFVRAGEDAAFPSSASNRMFVYDTSAGDLGATLRRAGEEYARAGVGHWFAHVGPGVDSAAVAGAMRELNARVWPHVRYPVLARPAAGELPAATTTLEARRVGPDDIRAHLGELETISDKPEGARAFLTAAGRCEFGCVMVFDGQPRRAVGTGMLAVSGAAGCLCFGLTHPEFRRRGGQSALIAERVRMARERGCQVCLSETVSILDTSMNNLLRAGFEQVFEWIVLETGRTE